MSPTYMVTKAIDGSIIPLNRQTRRFQKSPFINTYKLVQLLDILLELHLNAISLHMPPPPYDLCLRFGKGSGNTMFNFKMKNTLFSNEQRKVKRWYMVQCSSCKSVLLKLTVFETFRLKSCIDLVVLTDRVIRKQPGHI